MDQQDGEGPGQSLFAIIQGAVRNVRFFWNGHDQDGWHRIRRVVGRRKFRCPRCGARLKKGDNGSYVCQGKNCRIEYTTWKKWLQGALKNSRSHRVR